MNLKDLAKGESLLSGHNALDWRSYVKVGATVFVLTIGTIIGTVLATRAKGLFEGVTGKTVEGESLTDMIDFGRGS